MTARAKITFLAKRTQFYKHSRKQNRNFAPAHTICCEALAGKVKPRDYAICVPLKYRAARKTSAVSPLCGRARGVVLNSQDFAAVSSARNPRAFIISARFKAASFINDCACQNHIFGKAHSICRKLTALSERVNAAHFLTSEAPKMRRREKTCRRAASERRVFFQTHGKKFCLVQNFFREVRR